MFNYLPFRGWTNNVDANNLTWGVVYCGTNASNVPGAYCMILTFGDTSNDFAQLAICRQNGSMYFRSVIGAWSQVALQS